jgi:Xaa-Pro aminopeptidase
VTAPAPHSLADRKAAICAAMRGAGVARLLLGSNAHSQIDKFNPVQHVAGFRAVAPALMVLEADGSARGVASSLDAEHFAEAFVDHVATAGDLATIDIDPRGAATVGLATLPRGLAAALSAKLGAAPAFDKAFYAASARKTDAEIELSRRGVRIAEAGLDLMLDVAKPGRRECDVAVEVNLHMKELGANDSFLMLNAGPRADAVMPSSERRLEGGDLLLTELSPCVEGQFTQVCRTISIGEPKGIVVEKYPLLARAMREGIGGARPGATVGDVCSAIDDFLSNEGYAQYSRPPFIRRRGHGFGGGSMAPGDVAVDNPTVLEPGMVFIVHPNQFLPETGYMMCGDTILITPDGHEILSRETASLLGARA